MKSKKETIIIINHQDKIDGFFLFSTSVKKHYEKLVRKVGQENILETIISYISLDKKPTYWKSKVRISCLSPSLGLRRKRTLGIDSKTISNLAKARGSLIQSKQGSKNSNL